VGDLVVGYLRSDSFLQGKKSDMSEDAFFG